MLAKIALLAALTLPFGMAAQAAEQAPAKAAADPVAQRAVMTGEQVVQILDETVDWYRTLGTQQQAATQPSDLLILYANRQTADKVMALAFEIARANAELISSEAGVKEAQQEASTPEAQSLTRIRQKLEEQRTELQADIEGVRRQIAAASGTAKNELQARLSVLQGELDLINARRNLFSNMTQYASENTGANALKAHIDAIAASIPASMGPVTTMTTTTPAAGSTSVSSAVSTSLSQFGIWDLTATVLRLSAKARTIETIDRRTEDLQEVFTQIREKPLEQLKALTTRGDELAAEAEQDSSKLKYVRDQYDTIAWLFQQTSSIVTPLSKAEVLLTQYRNNLNNWRDATQRQYRDAWRALGIRLAIFAGLLALVFTAAEVYRRAVFRYVQDVRRRSRLLLLRKILLWALVVAIAAATFATELGSLATFAGLITAGLAVAMQSVLVSVVGYFFLIGKYGIRVGDRVQVGSVTGEVIDLGLVRLHLMELGGQDGAMSPTGRVVAFANSIVFQSSGGLFKQIPGINLAWHEITVRLPSGADAAALKTRLIEAVSSGLQDYRDDILRQTQEIQRTAQVHGSTDARPQVQLRFSAEGVDAIVRYPVELLHAAEIDERVSREVLQVISSETRPAA
ncbi:mechanosensitive ion channel family protein [Peristeroidobacter soli]|uniref:mechanosensitive ion channel family protein n=1 Tax=Peristeroidobacter soli TaxID=2497877 RepID=UPI00101CC543|nr:mechanosensitive ion channel family protein [Peristeroidobacter soli]